jgi:hypothetical protein
MATASMPGALKDETLRTRVGALSAFIESRPVVRELLIFFGFTLLTSVMTWPWITSLRDAVVDPGDPYLISWILWWDYHQTFHDPIHLFNANIFYPLTHTLAFTENDYGIALLFFPLFAVGFHPLTVNSIATFLGFAFCGYGAFRLTRTLTGSTSAAWIAGIIFAFIPYRFHLLSQLHYVFSGWLPLQLEALILFSRNRSWKRAVWFGVAFTMNALSCLTWFMLALTPLVFTTVFLVVRHQLYKDRSFWVRGGLVMTAATIVLLPFLLPYYHVSKAYGFTWSQDVVEKNSPTVLHWLMAEYRNRLWKGFGDGVPGGNYRLFPGLIPILLGVAALIVPSSLFTKTTEQTPDNKKVSAWVIALDLLAVVALTVAVLAAGWSRAVTPGLALTLINFQTVDRAILIAVVALLIRLMISYPAIVKRATGQSNLLQTIRVTKSEGLWIGLIWTLTGFFMSLGMNSWLFRVLFDFVFLFRGMREPSRAAMIACLGLAVLAGLGAVKIADVIRNRFSIRTFVVVGAVALVLLFELHAAPLKFMHGAVNPDALALRLKETPMQGGLVELPSGGSELPHLYMLRSADHARPLVNAISTFVPQHSGEIDQLARQSPIPLKLLDLLEEVPTSYLTIHYGYLDAIQRGTYKTFLFKAVVSGRLRFINRFDGVNDLYAIVKNEPEARSEARLPFETFDSWSRALENDPANLVSQYQSWSQQLYCVKVVATGALPRFDEFIKDAKKIGEGATAGWDDQFQRNLREYVERMVHTPEFTKRFGSLDNQHFVEQLLMNADLRDSLSEAQTYAADLTAGRETRASLLMKIATDPRVREKQLSRSVVLLHFFAYLRRNPDDPPDGNMNGFNYWVSEVEKHGGSGEDLARSFSDSIEYDRIRGKK